ncbi:MAG TPA: hypothetical protein VFK50_06215 [Sphingomicrobium sp.]|nr:hypothetical protein [Sphingomicrobium sp.]
MTLAFRMSAELEFCRTADVDRTGNCLGAAGLPTTLSDVGLAGRGAELAALMASDKKAGAGGLALILTRGIGRAFLSRDVSAAQLADFLDRAD